MPLNSLLEIIRHGIGCFMKPVFLLSFCQWPEQCLFQCLFLSSASAAGGSSQFLKSIQTPDRFDRFPADQAAETEHIVHIVQSPRDLKMISLKTKVLKIELSPSPDCQTKVSEPEYVFS